MYPFSIETSHNSRDPRTTPPDHEDLCMPIFFMVVTPYWLSLLLDHVREEPDGKTSGSIGITPAIDGFLKSCFPK